MIFVKLAATVSCLLVMSVSAQTCRDYVIISTRGTYEKQGPSIAFPGMINMTLAALPNGIEYDTVYPAGQDQDFTPGTDDIVRFVNNGIQSCPDQKYALLGYSQGAIATNVALKNYTDVNSAGYRAIAAIFVVGNPGHLSGSTSNFDEFGTTLTRNYNGSLYLGDDVGIIPDVFYRNGKVLDICHTRDSVCAPAYPNSSFIPYHILYGSTPHVQSQGADFLIGRLGGPNNTVTPVMPSSTATGGLSNATASGGLSTTSASSSSSSPPVASQTTNAASTWQIPSAIVLFGMISASLYSI